MNFDAAAGIEGDDTQYVGAVRSRAVPFGKLWGVVTRAFRAGESAADRRSGLLDSAALPAARSRTGSP
jgi:hypothetical protein